MKALSLFLFLYASSALAWGQEVLDDNEVVMYNPINWGPMVYVKADKIVEELVYSKIFDSNSEVTLTCDVPNAYSWYCNKTLPVVFNGLDGLGNKTKRVFLCEENSGLNTQKYYSEKLLLFKCKVSGGWSEEKNSFYAELHEET